MTDAFPPSGPTTLTAILASYLYQQYADDDNLQAFVQAYNSIAQYYLTWFVDTPLPVYTDPSISGPLLDWIAEGLYGMTRPTLFAGSFKFSGPFNTYQFNTRQYNQDKLVSPAVIAPVSDDAFKRIITWNFSKEDGNVFNVLWLKRRVMRFLLGVNGTSFNIDNTEPVSVLYGGGSVSILIGVGTRTVTGGAFFNRFEFNTMQYDRIETIAIAPAPGPMFAMEPTLMEAIKAGILVLPFQQSFVVRP